MSNITLRAERSAEMILAGGSPLEVVSVLVTELDLHLTRHMKSDLDLRSGGGGGRGQRDTGGCGVGRGGVHVRCSRSQQPEPGRGGFTV